MKRLLLILYLMGIVLAGGITATIAQDCCIADIPLVGQIEYNWCWNACSESVLRYYGNNVYQPEIAEWVCELAYWCADCSDCTCSPHPCTSCCNRGNYLFGTYYSIASILDAFGNIETISYNRELYRNEVQADACASTSKPWVFRWDWDGGGAHALVGRGFCQSSDVVYYMDPWPVGQGGFHTGDYDWMVDGSNHTWTRSLRVKNIKISGRISDGTTWLEGITVEKINDGERCAVSSVETGIDGYYEFYVPINWSGKIRGLPEGIYNAIEPVAYSYSEISEGYIGQDFTMSHISSWSDRPLTEGIPIDLRDCGLEKYTGPFFLRSTRTFAFTSDGSNGAIIAWYGERSTDGPGGIYVQRVNSDGEILWNAEGIYLGEASYIENGQPMIVSDEAGGAIIVWYNMDRYIRVQRVDGNGTILWPAPTAIDDPVFVQDSMDDPPLSDVYETIDATTDGDGGVFIAWSSSYELRLKGTRILSTGSLAYGWDGYPTGRIIDNSHHTHRVKIIPNTEDGAMIVYQTATYSLQDYTVRAHRIGPYAPYYTGWPVIIAPQTTNMHYHNACSDGGTGVIVTWNHWDVVRAQYITGNAGKPWGEAGVVVCTAASSPFYPHIVTDGSAGAIIAWEDQRNETEGDIYAQRILADGSIGWQANGLPVCTAAGAQRDLRMISMSDGGAMAVWVDDRWGEYDIYAERILSNGSTSSGDGSAVVVADATGEQIKPKLISDNDGGAIFAWRDDRNDWQHIYAMRRVIVAPITWSGDIYLTSDFVVEPNIILTVEPGTNVFAALTDAGAGGSNPSKIEIIVEGEIDVNGTVAEPVEFRSVTPTTKGDWVGIFLTEESAGGDFDYCTIKHTEYAIETYVPIALDNCVIDSVDYCGVVVQRGNTTIDNSTISNSDCFGVFLGASTLTISGSAVDDNLSAGVELNGYDTLYAYGSSFSNNDKGMILNNGAVARIDNSCTFEDNEVGISIHQAANIHVKNSSFEGNTTAIYCNHYGHPLIAGNTITGNGTGVYCYDSSHPTIKENSITFNTTGVYAATNSRPDVGRYGLTGNNYIYHHNAHIVNATWGITIMAEGNYWGSPRGPKPYKFIGDVDYIPYLTSPPSLTSPADGYDVVDTELPPAFKLSQIAPNPFNPTTRISYEIPDPGSNVRIAVYNIAGQLVRTLVDEYKKPGYYNAVWDGRDNRGQSVASSMYFVQMIAGSFRETKKAILLR